MKVKRLRNDELYHYGVKGMKWHQHKAKAEKKGGIKERVKAYKRAFDVIALGSIQSTPIGRELYDTKTGKKIFDKLNKKYNLKSTKYLKEETDVTFKKVIERKKDKYSRATKSIIDTFK